MFFQDITPDTSGYMIAGYAIAFIVMGLYVTSMYMRSRNLKQDMSTLEEMDKPVAPVIRPEPKIPAKSAATKKTKTVTKKSGKK
jgi:hypothetical protein